MLLYIITKYLLKFLPKKTCYHNQIYAISIHYSIIEACKLHKDTFSITTLLSLPDIAFSLPETSLCYFCYDRLIGYYRVYSYLLNLLSFHLIILHHATGRHDTLPLLYW
jgi:hypothetical protein